MRQDKAGLGARGPDPAGLDHVHVDVMFKQLDGHRLHHRIERRLGRAVGDTTGIGNAGEDAGDEDNLARLFPRDEVTADELAHVEAAEEGRLQDTLEDLALVIEEARATVVGRHTDEGIDIAEFGEGGGHDGLAALARKGVGLDRYTADPERADRVGGSGELGAARSVGEDDGGTFFREFQGAPEPDPAGSAGDDGDVVFQLHGFRF